MPQMELCFGPTKKFLVIHQIMTQDIKLAGISNHLIYFRMEWCEHAKHKDAERQWRK